MTIAATARILVVDDEPLVVQMCTHVLAEAGYQAHGAVGGPEALARLEEEHFDLLLVDIMMPDVDGLMVLRRARELDPGMATVIITGYGTLEHAIQALQTGARDFILKPFGALDLLSVVNQVVEKRRQEQENLLLRARLPILELSQALMTEGDTEALAGRLLDVVVRQVGADRASLMLLDEQTHELYIAGAIGLSAEVVQTARIPVGQGIAGRVLLREEPLVLDEAASLDPAWQPWLSQPEVASAISLPLRVAEKAVAKSDPAASPDYHLQLPLRVGGRAVGVLNLSRTKRAGRALFTPGELSQLAIMGSPIAAALESARLYAAGQQQIAALSRLSEELRRELAERQRTGAALERRVAQLALLSDVGGKVAAMLELDRVLDRAAHLVQERFGYHHVALFTLDRERGELMMRAKAGDFAHLYPPDHRLKLGQGVVGWVGRHGQNLLANDVCAEPRYVNLYPDLIPTRSELSVPIRVSGETVGVLDIQSSQLNAFDENDLLVMETLTDQIAAAVENARLYEAVQRELAERKRTEEEIRQRNRELALLNHVGQVFNSTLELDRVLVTVLEEVRRLLNVTACSVWLIEPATRELVCWQVTGPHSERVCGWRLALGQGVAGWVADHGESLIVPDTRADERHYKDIDRHTGLESRSILCIPLRVREGVIGVIEVVDAAVDRFRPPDRALIELLAASAASAIQNARLFEQVQAAQERLKLLTRQIVSAQEEERLRLSRELHDEIGQALTILRINLELTREDLPVKADSLRQRINGAMALIDQTAGQLRQLAHGLRPPALEALGLDPTLEDFCLDLARRTGLSISYGGAELPALPDAVNYGGGGGYQLCPMQSISASTGSCRRR